MELLFSYVIELVLNCDGSIRWSGQPGSNWRPQPWQGCALPTELYPHDFCVDLSFRPGVVN